jgi:hypothetical protein
MEDRPMPDNDSNALIERLRRLHRFWKRLALVALLLLVIGVAIGGWLIARAYSLADLERKRAEAAEEKVLLRQLLMPFRDSTLPDEDLETLRKHAEAVKGFQPAAPSRGPQKEEGRNEKR